MGSIDGDRIERTSGCWHLEDGAGQDRSDSPPIDVGDFFDEFHESRSGHEGHQSWIHCWEGFRILGLSAKARPCRARPEPYLVLRVFREFRKIEAFVNLGYYIGAMTADGYIDTQQKFIAGDVKVDMRAEIYKRLMGELNLPVDSAGSLRNANQLTEVSPSGGFANFHPPDTVSASVAEILSAFDRKDREQ